MSIKESSNNLKTPPPLLNQYLKMAQFISLSKVVTEKFQI